MAFPQSLRAVRRPTPRTLRTPLFLALAMALPVAAMAQDSGQDPRHDDKMKDLDRVVVNASPLRRDAEDLIRPVEVLGGEALDNAKANSLGETVGRLPGVQASYFGPGVGRPIIRGLDGARVQVLSDGLSAGDVSTVSVDHAVSIEPFLADQIEVLKGPATLLYGSGAIGGAVNVVEGRVPHAVTAEPIEGRAEVRFGTGNDEKTAMARMDATAANGKLVFHIDGLHRETGDYDIPGYAEHAHEGDEDHEPGARGRLPNSFVRTDAGASACPTSASAGTWAWPPACSTRAMASPATRMPTTTTAAARNTARKASASAWTSAAPNCAAACAAWASSTACA